MNIKTATRPSISPLVSEFEQLTKLPQLWKKSEPFFIGFDKVFHDMENIFTGLAPQVDMTYPIHNLVKTEDGYTLEFALSGFKKEDLSVEYKPGILRITGNTEKQKEDKKYLYRSIATRSFTREFNIADSLEVGDVSFVDGLLSVHLKQTKPLEDEMKKLTIK